MPAILDKTIPPYADETIAIDGVLLHAHWRDPIILIDDGSGFHIRMESTVTRNGKPYRIESIQKNPFASIVTLCVSPTATEELT